MTQNDKSAQIIQKIYFPEKYITEKWNELKDNPYTIKDVIKFFRKYGCFSLNKFEGDDYNLATNKFVHALTTVRLVTEFYDQYREEWNVLSLDEIKELEKLSNKCLKTMSLISKECKAYALSPNVKSKAKHFEKDLNNAKYEIEKSNVALKKIDHMTKYANKENCVVDGMTYKDYLKTLNYNNEKVKDLNLEHSPRSVAYKKNNLARKTITEMSDLSSKLKKYTKELCDINIIDNVK